MNKKKKSESFDSRHLTHCVEKERKYFSAFLSGFKTSYPVQSTAGPIRNVQKFRKIETVRDSRRIYQCRKPNLPHNQQLLHASARVHKNMKHARILPLVKNIISQ